MGQDITWVGIDAHKDSLSVAVWLPDKEGIREWRTRADKLAIVRLIKKLKKVAPGKIECCYEAGPCGYELQRELDVEERIRCMVVAPSLVPRKPGQRVKTDRRDARHLLGQLRAGELTEVYPPSREDESTRDLCRYRDQVRRDRMRCRDGRLLERCAGSRGPASDGSQASKPSSKAGEPSRRRQSSCAGSTKSGAVTREWRSWPRSSRQACRSSPPGKRTGCAGFQ